MTAILVQAAIILGFAALLILLPSRGGDAEEVREKILPEEPPGGTPRR